MYQAHQTDWFDLGFIVCVGLVAALAAFAQFGKVKLPNYVFILPIGLAVLLMVTMSWLRMADERKLRAELSDLNPLAVSNVVVSAEAFRHRLTETNELIPLFNQLQQVQPVPAHHSHPTDIFEVGFMLNGHQYRYQIGRDSERADEYWVFKTARAPDSGREIGRVQSSTMGQVLNSLVHGQSPTQP